MNVYATRAPDRAPTAAIQPARSASVTAATAAIAIAGRPAPQIGRHGGPGSRPSPGQRERPPTIAPAVVTIAPITSRPIITTHGNGSGPLGGRVTATATPRAVLIARSTRPCHRA
jgi:hypothetical protein